MYKKRKTTLASKEDLGNYIEGFDVYNSLLLLRLSDTSLPRELYQIETYEYRPDLIAKDFYGSESYLAYVMLQGGRDIQGYKKGIVLKLVSKDTLDLIIDKL